MKLHDLVETDNDIDSNIEITSLAFDTKDVKEGTLFFCLVGSENDGHAFAAEAQERGAVAFVTERKLALDCVQIEVEDTRHALAIAAQRFFGNPAKELKLIGITGTNGKTTTTYILKSILDAAGKSSGVIGTNAVIIGETASESKLTTPDPIELNRIFRDMVDAGIEYAIMEVSAHALKLRKLDGLIFEVAAFTNLSRDHLDFFADMEEYGAVKRSFFTPAHARCCVVNADDETGRRIVQETKLSVVTYGCLNPSDVFGIDLSMSALGLTYVLNSFDAVTQIKFNLTGRFNMYNTLCAAAIAHQLDVKVDTVAKGIANLKKVDGRFNIVNTSKCSIIIDFAHTDDGIANLLRAVREFAPAKIITVFGCGGNRDKSKRPVMGKIVSTLSDECIITSDNPRYEPPLEIISDIEKGIKELGNTNYRIVADRKEAILTAIENAHPDDIVLIAGKGAEKYQEVMGEKRPYNDEKFIMEIAKEYNF